MRLHDCLCEFSEVKNEANTDVKGYVLVSECDECKAKREGENEKLAIEEQAVAEAEAEKEIKKASAKAKLLALGLTEEEIEALLS
jgi:hypothetical protein